MSIETSKHLSPRCMLSPLKNLTQTPCVIRMTRSSAPRPPAFSGYTLHRSLLRRQIRGTEHMKRVTEFLMNADRYQFDFGECSASNGFAQIDTTEDAWY